MKILVTGHKGFIGSNMIKALETNHEVSTYEWGDKLPTIKGLDWVMHFGAISATTERNIEKIIAQNVDSSVWFLQECAKHNVNLQYSSSASVYGLKQKFTETSPLDPRNPYAWSKVMFEWYTKQFPTNIQVQGFRYFNVYGQGEDHKGNQASPYHQFEKQAKETKRIKLFKDSDLFFRDFVPVETIIDTHIKFLEVKESGVWNIGTGKTKSFQEVAETIATNHNAEIDYIDMPAILKDNYQAYTCADMTKTNTSLGKL
jgi:ADP-L-glycero-D-manno-heptose 6-epimerase